MNDVFDQTIRESLARLKRSDLANYGKDFLLTWEKTREQLTATALVAEILSELHRRGVSFRRWASGIAISIFRDKSTRTRYSYAAAANALGLAVEALDEEKSQIAHGETVRETAAMLSFLTEVIGIRDDMYLGHGHRYMREVADAVQESFEAQALHRRPSVVNLQCDLDHPTQTLADLLALKRHFGSLDALRGKKLAMSWAYSPSYGKPLSVPQGIIALLPRFGMEVALAHPPGYDLVPEVLETSRRNAAEGGGALRVTSDMGDAFDGADAVYPKSWAPMSVMQERTKLLQAGDRDGLKTLERECLARNADFAAWECNDAHMKRTRGGGALYLHCLPADISGVSCERGEVSAEVFERYRLATYHEAGFKPFVIAAMIWLARVPEPIAALERLIET